jgi:type IV secretory pathway VirB6-like protein
MGLLTFITQSCDTLTATASPTIDALGIRMVIALATIMLVWFGAQEALASASGGSGFSMARFISLFMLLTFAYAMVAFYDSAIPGIGLSLKGFINGGAQYLVQVIGNDSAAQIAAALAQAQAAAQPGIIKIVADPYYALCFFFVQVMLGLWAAMLGLIVGYGALASTVVGLFGPIMIPWMVFDKTAFLFWGWLRAFIAFCFYKVVAAAVLFILGHVFTNYVATLATTTDPGTMVKQFPLLILLVVINVYMLWQVPHLTMSIFSGSSGGHGGGMSAGIATAATLALRG